MIGTITKRASFGGKVPGTVLSYGNSAAPMQRSAGQGKPCYRGAWKIVKERRRFCVKDGHVCFSWQRQFLLRSPKQTLKLRLAGIPIGKHVCSNSFNCLSNNLLNKNNRAQLAVFDWGCMVNSPNNAVVCRTSNSDPHLRIMYINGNK